MGGGPELENADPSYSKDVNVVPDILETEVEVTSGRAEEAELAHSSPLSSKLMKQYGTKTSPFCVTELKCSTLHVDSEVSAENHSNAEGKEACISDDSNDPGAGNKITTLEVIHEKSASH